MDYEPRTDYEMANGNAHAMLCRRLVGFAPPVAPWLGTFDCEIIEVIVQMQGTSTNGTMKITNGTNDITDAMVVAVDKTIVRAGTIDNAYSSLEIGDTLEVVCAGNSVAATIGLVTVIVKPTL